MLPQRVCAKTLVKFSAQAADKEKNKIIHWRPILTPLSQRLLSVGRAFGESFWCLFLSVQSVQYCEGKKTSRNLKKGSFAEDFLIIL